MSYFFFIKMETTWIQTLITAWIVDFLCIFNIIGNSALSKMFVTIFLHSHMLLQPPPPQLYTNTSGNNKCLSKKILSRPSSTYKMILVFLQRLSGLQNIGYSYYGVDQQLPIMKTDFQLKHWSVKNLLRSMDTILNTCRHASLWGLFLTATF